MTNEILENLEFVEVINDSPNLKWITILAKDKSDQNAIIIIRKDPISNEFQPQKSLKSFGLNINQQTFVNNEYSKYNASSIDGYFDSINIEIIYPAVEWQIKKHSRKSMAIFTESRDFYDKYTKKYIENLPSKSIDWLYAILEGNKEQETIYNGVFNAKSIHNSTYEPVSTLTIPENIEDLNTKFIITKDYKWTDESNLSLLYYLAIPLRRDLLSIRDLRSEHIPLLKAMRLQGISVCNQKHNLEDEKIAMYIHYHPTFWHLHVHITHTDMMFEFAKITKCILLDDIIDHLQMDDQYFVKKSFKISMFKEHQLYEDIKMDQSKQKNTQMDTNIELKHTILRRSWEKVRAIDDTFAATGVILFRHIFTIAPEALGIFSFKDEPDLYTSPKLIKHGQNVMKYVDKLVADLEKEQDEKDENNLNKLGKRHVGYGVEIPHYAVVGQALIATLADGLGAEFTDELKAHWVELYGTIQNGMTKGNY